MKTFAVLCAALVLVGTACSRLPVPASKYDSNSAKALLIDSLEAWKQGKTAELEQRMPSVRFMDDDLSAGMELDDYRLNEPDIVVEPHRGVVVEIFVRPRGGALIRKRAEYQVVLWPHLAVLRADP